MKESFVGAVTTCKSALANPEGSEGTLFECVCFSSRDGYS